MIGRCWTYFILFVKCVTIQEHESKKADLYEHVKDSKSHYDEQTLDVATAEQQEEQGKITPDNEDADNDVDDDTEMMDDKEDNEV